MVAVACRLAALAALCMLCAECALWTLAAPCTLPPRTLPPCMLPAPLMLGGPRRLLRPPPPICEPLTMLSACMAVMSAAPRPPRDSARRQAAARLRDPH